MTLLSFISGWLPTGLGFSSYLVLIVIFILTLLYLLSGDPQPSISTSGQVTDTTAQSDDNEEARRKDESNSSDSEFSDNRLSNLRRDRPRVDQEKNQRGSRLLA